MSHGLTSEQRRWLKHLNKIVSSGGTPADEGGDGDDGGDGVGGPARKARHHDEDDAGSLIMKTKRQVEAQLDDTDSKLERELDDEDEADVAEKHKTRYPHREEDAPVGSEFKRQVEAELDDTDSLIEKELDEEDGDGSVRTRGMDTTGLDDDDGATPADDNPNDGDSRDRPHVHGRPAPIHIGRPPSPILRNPPPSGGSTTHGNGRPPPLVLSVKAAVGTNGGIAGGAIMPPAGSFKPPANVSRPLETLVDPTAGYVDGAFRPPAGSFDPSVDVTRPLKVAVDPTAVAADADPTPPASSAPPLNAIRPFEISGSVGLGGKNAPNDSQQVQSALNRSGASLTVDGKIGPKSIAAIRAFQQKNGIPADGLISVGHRTAAALAGNHGAAPPANSSMEDIQGPRPLPGSGARAAPAGLASAGHMSSLGGKPGTPAGPSFGGPIGSPGGKPHAPAGPAFGGQMGTVAGAAVGAGARGVAAGPATAKPALGLGTVDKVKHAANGAYDTTEQVVQGIEQTGEGIIEDAKKAFSGAAVAGPFAADPGTLQPVIAAVEEKGKKLIADVSRAIPDIRNIFVGDGE